LRFAPGDTHKVDSLNHPIPSEPATVSWREALRTWAYIGVHSFGGPAGQIAVMHKVLVEKKKWISEERFLHALHYCMLLPGPEAMQLATYIGWLMHRTLGGLVAGTLFVLPGFVSILALSLAYTLFRDVGVIQSMLFGLKAAVLVIVIEALIRIGRRALRSPLMSVVAAASFLAMFLFDAPFPLVIGVAALVGLLGSRLAPRLFAVKESRDESSEQDGVYLTDHIDASHTRPSAARTLGVLAVWMPLWLGPVVLLGAMLGWNNIFAAQAVFFSKAAVVTFGGAYAVLSYIAQQAVEVHHWLEPGEMLTGLGFAESTPGPLIQVVQFVGYMGAYRNPGELHPLMAATLASMLVTWVTFTPCFLWIFLGAPYMESVRKNVALRAALMSVTAAVVGVILNLALWFSLHTLFSEVRTSEWGAMRVLWPVPGSVDVPAAVIAAIAGIAIFRFRTGIMLTLAIAVAASLIWFAVSGAGTNG